MTEDQAKSHGVFWARNGRNVTLARCLAKIGELRDTYGELVADAFIEGVMSVHGALRSRAA